MWPFGKQKRELNSLRTKQINELQAVNKQFIQQVSKDTFLITLPTQYGPLKFNVILDDSFPESPPQMKMLARVSHPYVTANLQIETAELKVWNAHSSLGRIVKNILDAFTHQPPIPVSSSQPQNAIVLPSAYQPAGGRQHIPVAIVTLPEATPWQQDVGGHIMKSADAAARKTKLNSVLIDVERVASQCEFSELENMSTEELEAILLDCDAMKILAHKQAPVQRETSLLHDLAEDAQVAAERNLSEKNELEEIQKNIRDMKEQFKRELDELNTLMTRKNTTVQRFSVENILQVLEDSMYDAEDKAIEAKKQYCNLHDNDDVEDDKKKRTNSMKLLDQYFEARKLYHMRSAKRERVEFR